MVTFDLRRLRMVRELEERGTLGAVAAALGYTRPRYPSSSPSWRRKRACGCWRRPVAECS
jgi:hypothetical protein